MIGLGSTLLVTLVATAVFLHHIVTKSYPITRGTLSVQGLHSAVDIYRDDYGVPHIRAGDEHDMAFAAGYVQAQDRLWQMDLLRRAGEGRLSEILGKEALDFDILFRTIRLGDIAERIEDHLHPESRELLESYAAGVNSFISTHHGKFPVEFDMLNYSPEPWTVRHSILISRLVAWELNLSWWTDLAYGEIASRVPLQKLQEIIPVFPDSVPVTVPSAAQRVGISGVGGIMEIARSYRDAFGLGPG